MLPESLSNNIQACIDITQGSWYNVLNTEKLSKKREAPWSTMVSDNDEVDKETEAAVAEAVFHKLMSTEELRDKLAVIVPGLYKSWRTNQFEVIEQIYRSDKSIVGVHAPTGFGKSVSASGTVMVAGDRGIILVGTKQLGEQYYEDFRTVGLRTVKGRGNFPCEIMPEKGADTAPCVAGMKCMYKRGGCQYYDQKREASAAQLASMNIHYFLHEANFGGEFSDVDILFIDEAHKLETTLQQFIEIRLSFERFSDEGQDIPKGEYRNIPNLMQWAEKAFGTMEAELNQCLEELELDPRNDIITARAIRLKAACNNLEKFSMVDDTWIIEEDKYAVILKPVWVAKYLEQILLRHAQKVVLMSATLPRNIMESLGLFDYEYIQLFPTFNVANRPVIWIPAANLARSASDPAMEQKKLIAVIDNLMERHQNEKGIIHTVNYRIGEAILSGTKYADRIITHKEAGDREKILDQFRANNTNAVLMSPSFTEGVDLPYNQCRWQVIAKIPYGDLGNKQIKARMENDNAWYATNAIVNMIQAYGRIMRAEDDSGITYILDTSLMNLINRWKTVFEQLTGFLDALFINEKGRTIPYNDWLIEKGGGSQLKLD